MDINDFPSFYGVPRKVASVAEYILHAAYRARLERSRNASQVLIQSRKLPHRQDNKSIKPAELLPRSVHVRRSHMH